jgi:hypothetical protein
VTAQVYLDLFVKVVSALAGNVGFAEDQEVKKGDSSFGTTARAPGPLRLRWHRAVI